MDRRSSRPTRAEPGAAGELPAPRLTCREVVELVSDHLDGRLAPRQRARVTAHLAACAECAAYVEQVRATIAALRRLRADDMPVAIRARIVAALRRRRARER